MVVDHSTMKLMETMAISKFKATCLAVLEQVRKTGKPIRITRRGEPIADVVPPDPPEMPDDWLGAMAKNTRTLGDIVVPSGDLIHWEVEG